MLVESSAVTDSAELCGATVAVVVVNYGTADLVVQCLDSLQTAQNQCSSLRVLVVDNASADDSVERIQAAINDRSWTDWVEVIVAPRNGGFSYGNNLGIRRALAANDPQVDAVWLLNSDTIVRPQALDALLAAFDRDPSAGIVGSRLEDRDGTPQRSAFGFQTVSREW